VSWRFDDPEGAEQVAILVPGATPNRFKVIAYNTSDHPQHATMTGWDIAAGTWRMSSGIDSNGDDKADGPVATQEVPLERSASVGVAFAPHQTTVLEFALDRPTGPVEQRADLGIGPDDVRLTGRQLSVTVHSLGAVPAAGGSLQVRDASGRVVATASIPPLPAPLDLHPKTAEVRVSLPAGFVPRGSRVTVGLAGGAPEVTRLNNDVVLP
jgi:hypothetical protein